MKKIFLSLIVAGLTVGAFASDLKCDGHCQKDSKKEKMHDKCDMKKEKFNEMSLEDIKKHVSEKISFDEKRIVEQKECLNKNTKEELRDCMKASKPEKHHGCNMMKKEAKKPLKGEEAIKMYQPVAN